MRVRPELRAAPRSAAPLHLLPVEDPVERSGAGPTPPCPLPAASSQAGKTCGCGHEKQAHQHYRRGTDCALCSCARYHRRLFPRLRR